MDQQTGKYVIASGIFIVAAGVLIYFFHDYFKWFGKLPGISGLKRKITGFIFLLLL